MGLGRREKKGKERERKTKERRKAGMVKGEE